MTRKSHCLEKGPNPQIQGLKQSIAMISAATNNEFLNLFYWENTRIKDFLSK